MTPEMWKNIKRDFYTKWPKSVIDKLDFQVWYNWLSTLSATTRQAKLMEYKRTHKVSYKLN